MPQMQVNIARKSTDQGILADTISTGGTAVYLSPGVGASIIGNLMV